MIGLQMQKKKMAIGIGIALASGCALPTPAFAWGNEGHQIIALIAQTMLTERTTEAVQGLLAEDKDGLTKSDFPSRATWADEYREKHPETSGWHFVNLDLRRPSMADACRTKRSCIVRQLDKFAAELADPYTPKKERLLAFKMVLHLAGDIHQPLHAADSHDRGGNCEVVTIPGKVWGSWWPTKTSLHAFWDTGIVAQMGRDPSELAAQLRRRITPAEARKWSRGTPTNWAWESYNVARSVSYRFGGPPDCQGGSTELSPAYITATERAATIQLQRAGVRLAGLLNGTLGRVPAHASR